jgi:hypothetical protein
MLASITPLGERGRQSIWGVTVTAFGLGATGAGVLAGAILGAAGSVAPRGGVEVRWAVLLAALVAALAVDAGLPRVPGPRRQVDPGWLDRYRGWVYGFGYGAQLGLGVTTVISSAALYVALLAAVLSGSALDGAVVMGVYGLVRGLTPLAAAGVSSTRELVAVQRGLERWRGPAHGLAYAALGLAAAGAAIGALG